MRMQPRQELLDIWRAVVKTSWRPDEERWEWGGLYAASSIGHAEQVRFLRVFRNTTRRVDVQKQIERLEEMASTRLSAAMVGLLRSFSVNVFDTNSLFGRNILRMVNQNGAPTRQVVAQLQTELRQTAAS